MRGTRNTLRSFRATIYDAQWIIGFLTKKNSRRIVDNTLTNKEAFEAMRIFLEHYDERGRGTDTLRDVLGDISSTFWADGGPNDPAQWNDWLDAVSEVIAARK